MEPRPRTRMPATPIAAWTQALGADVHATLRICDRSRKRGGDGRTRRQQDQIVLRVRCVGALHLEVNLTDADALAAVRARAGRAGSGIGQREATGAQREQPVRTEAAALAGADGRGGSLLRVSGASA